MEKVLSVGKALDFVTAVSGVFITPSNSSGLTVREREVVASFLDLSGGSPINPRINKELWKTLKASVGLKTQSMSNMMRVLRQKKVVEVENGLYKLHPIFRKGESLSIKYE